MRRFLLFILVLAALIPLTSAGVISVFNDLEGCHYVPYVEDSHLATIDYEGAGILVCDDNRIDLLNLDEETNITIISNCSLGDITDVLILPCGDMYFSVSTNLYYAHTSEDDSLDFYFGLISDDIELVDTRASSIGYLAYDESGFVLYPAGSSVYSIDVTNQITSTIETLGSFLGAKGLCVNNVTTQYHVTGRYGGAGDNNLRTYIGDLNGSTYLYHYTGNNGWFLYGSQATVDNTLYCVGYYADAWYIMRSPFIAQSSKSYHQSIVGYSCADMCISPEGIIYVMTRSGDILTYATLDYVGGYGYYEPDVHTIIPDKTAYYTGESATIATHVRGASWDADTYDYAVNCYDSNGLRGVLPVDTQDDSVVFPFNAELQESSGFLWSLVMYPEGSPASSTVLAQNYSQYYRTDTSYSVSFDQSEYLDGETMTIYYTDMPEGSTLLLRGNHYGTYTWSVSGSGSKTATAQDYNDYYTAQGVWSSYVLASDSATVSGSPSSFTIHGYCRDSKTRAAISGVNVTIGDESCTSSSIGWYSITVVGGDYWLTASKSGYQAYNSSVWGLSFGDADVTFNPYLISESSVSNSSVYGVVSDYSTGEPLGSAYVELSNVNGTYATYSNSGGFYEIINISAGNYTLSAARFGYISLSEDIVVSSLPFHQDIGMVPEGYIPPDAYPAVTSLIDTNNDGYTSEDELREFVISILSVFFILLFVMFLGAFGPGRR